MCKQKKTGHQQSAFYLPIKLTKNTIIEEVEKQEYVCVYTHTHVLCRHICVYMYSYISISTTLFFSEYFIISPIVFII